MKHYWLLAGLAAAALAGSPAVADPPASPAAEAVQGGPAAEETPAGQPCGGAAAEEERKPKLTYGGSADFYFLTNFNDPFDGMNALRAFDVLDERGPHLGLIDLWAQYARDPIGFRLDLNFGRTAHLVNAFEPSNGDVWAHVQQVFVSANLNREGTTYLDFGKWVTNAGAEVIEPKDNWLYSRGLLFNLAIPFYHFGLRGYHYFNETDYIAATINRGWNAVGHPNHGIGFMLMGSKAVTPEWTVTAQYHGGDEFLGTKKSWRNLVDLIALYSPAGKTSYSFNFDWVNQSGNHLYGLSAMAKYAIDEKSYLAARGEFLVDDGFLGTDVYSVTLGYSRKLHQNLETRAEFRYDWASQDVFSDDRRGRFKGNMPTFLISAIVSYQ